MSNSWTLYTGSFYSLLTAKEYKLGKISSFIEIYNGEHKNSPDLKF